MNHPRLDPLDLRNVSTDDFDDEQSTQCTQMTQEFVDPRRLGLNASGLHAEDVSDVICILHPSTPAAYKLTREHSRAKPQFCLQYRDLPEEEPPEDVTFIVDEDEAARRGQAPLDLAFRFSNRPKQAQLGLTFGRNPESCDIAITRDTNRRISNTHFCIHLNETGVLMIKDLSTNGTMVDEMLLKGSTSHHPHSRMLTQGSVIQVLSPSPDEVVKFIVRFPQRDEHYPAYENAMQNYLIRQAEVIRQWRMSKGLPVGPPDFTPRRHTTFTALMPNNNHGMRWNGGKEYNVVGTVGKGAFASVYQLATKRDGHLYAAKELEKRRFMKNGILDRKLDNEMEIMQSISHPSVVDYRGWHEEKDYLYIIMEYVPCGDLQQYLAQYGPLPEKMGKQMAHQILDALDYLHKKNITHRDIKPDNILLLTTEPEDFRVKLSDFGLSKVINHNDTFLKTFCGTLLYCAPEVFPHYDSHPAAQRGVKRSREPRAHRKFHSYSHAVDVWSFGAVLWYTLCHKPPFEGIADATGRGMFDNIMHTPLDASPLIKRGVSSSAIDLLVSMLNTDHLARFSAEDCLRHPWFGLENPPQRPYELALHDIQEEDHDAVAGAEEDVASLSLDERAAAAATGFSQYQDEVSLNESDMDFLDPRKSKRVKTTNDDNAHSEEPGDSSSESMKSIPIVDDTQLDSQAHAQARPPPQPVTLGRTPKLFGEISQTNVKVPAFAGERHAVMSSRTDSQADAPSGQSQSTLHGQSLTGSLRGTEALVRGMDIDSPFLPSSFDTTDVEDGDVSPADTPLRGSVEDDHNELTVSNDQEETPRQVPFKREIIMPLLASYYYDPADPSTHNAEYASRVSGHDFVKEPKYYPKRPLSMPSTHATRNTTVRNATETVPSTEARLSYSGFYMSAAGSEVILSGAEYPTTKRGDPVGRLVSTPDSFANVTIELTRRNNTFGRDRHCTTVYEDKEDTRVGKFAFTIFTHATGIENIPEGEEHLDALPGAYVGILTHSSNGVSINGEKLRKSEGPGRQTYGKLHTGDVIEVYPRLKKQKGLHFIAEINQGEGKTRRSGSNRFVVEMESPYSSPFAQTGDHEDEVPYSNQAARG